MPWAEWLALQLNKIFDDLGAPSVGRARKIPSNISAATVRDGIRKSEKWA